MNNEFNKKVDEMFESKLKYEEVPYIRIKNLQTQEIIENINYEKLIRLDSDLNIYKMFNNNWVKVDNENFKAIVLCNKKFTEQ